MWSLLVVGLYLLVGWLLGCGAAAGVTLVWLVPGLLWLVYPPLTVCAPRALYSHPRGPTPPFWCSRPCEEGTVVVARTIDEVVEAVTTLPPPVRAVGGRHSASELQCGTTVLSVEVCPLLRLLDDGVVVAGGGCRVGDVLRFLVEDRERQLRGFGGIVEQTMAGAVSTSLHGQHPTPFAHDVVGVRAVLANGSTVETHDVAPWVGSMGMLGVLVEVRMRTWPIEYAECTTVAEANASAFLDALVRPGLVGFEAKRYLARRDTYVLRTCVASSSPRRPFRLVDYDDEWSAFVSDHVVLAAGMLLGTAPLRSVLFASTAVASSREGVVATANDFRNRVSYSPRFDAEYAVPAHACHTVLEALRDVLPFAFVRRIDGAPGWLTWATNGSCALRLEHLDPSVSVAEEGRLRRVVESVVVAHGGCGHFGKPWHGDLAHLLSCTPRDQVAAFEAYRARLDPDGVFQNDYTLAVRNTTTSSSSSFPVLAPSLDTRTVVWRVSVWLSLAAVVVTCVLRWRRHCHPAPWRVRTDPTPAAPAQRGRPRHAPSSRTGRSGRV